MNADRLLRAVLFIALLAVCDTAAAVPISLENQFTLPDSIYPSLSKNFIKVDDFDGDGGKDIVIYGSSVISATSLLTQQPLTYFHLSEGDPQRKYYEADLDDDSRLDLVEAIYHYAPAEQSIVLTLHRSGDSYVPLDTIVLWSNLADTNTYTLDQLVVADLDHDGAPEAYIGFYWTEVYWPYPDQSPETRYHWTRIRYNTGDGSVGSVTTIPPDLRRTYSFPIWEGQPPAHFNQWSYSYSGSAHGVGSWDVTYFGFTAYNGIVQAGSCSFHSPYECQSFFYDYVRASCTDFWVGDFVVDLSGMELLVDASYQSYTTGLDGEMCSYRSRYLHTVSLTGVSQWPKLWDRELAADFPTGHWFSEPSVPDRLFLVTPDTLFLIDAATLQPVERTPVSLPGVLVDYTALEPGGVRYLIMREARTFRFYRLDLSTDTDEPADDRPLPGSFTLSEPYPNPFNATVHFSVSSPAAEELRVEVFNLLGQQVSLLWNGKLAAGERDFSWTAEGCASGLYMLKVSNDRATETRRIILLK